MSFQPTYSYLTNQMTQVGSSTPTYDANGNATNDTAHTYTWDANGKPVTVDSVALTYDALGRMVEQNTSGTYSQIMYAPSGGKLAIMDGATLQKAFVPLIGGSQAVYLRSGLAYYRHSDWIGSSRFDSTPSGTRHYDGAYAPFGEAYAQIGTADLSFTGMNQDTVANLYDFPAREYNDIHGRWPSPDPAGISAVSLRDPQTWNRYVYVRNNPLRMTDPSGLCGDDGFDGYGGDSGDGPIAAAKKSRIHSAYLPVIGGDGGDGCDSGDVGSIDYSLVDNQILDGSFSNSAGTFIQTNDMDGLFLQLAGGTIDELADVYQANNSDTLNPDSQSLIFLNNTDTNIGELALMMGGVDTAVVAVPFAPAAIDAGTAAYANAQTELILWQAAGDLGSYQSAEDLILGATSPLPGPMTTGGVLGNMIGCELSCTEQQFEF
ncbi:MAG: RHS repeat-associated core domain-containing protein [Candidatus Acidiferrales bacterium]